MPHNGSVSFAVKVPSLRNSMFHSGMFLAVEDTAFETYTPIPLGTNILKPLMKQINSGTMKRTHCVNAPWLVAFRTISIKGRHLRRSAGTIGQVHNQGTRLVVPRKSSVILNGDFCSNVPFSGLVMLEASAKAKLPEGLQVDPAIVYCTSQVSLPVHLTNTSNKTLVVQPRALCASVVVAKLATRDLELPSEDFSFIDLLEIENGDLPLDEQPPVIALLKQWHHVFSKHDLDIGLTSAVEHTITLIHDKPLKQKYRRIPPSIFQEVKDHLHQLHEAGVIRPSRSPYSPNLVFARKADSSLRLCYDFRQLNSLTIKDAYALPRIEEMFENLKGSSFFSVLDMKSGYHQVPLAEKDIPKTAFSAGPLGHWEHSRLAFGLTNSPATYQRLMETIFAGENHRFVMVYLDDLLVFSPTLQEHKAHLESIFERLAEYNLKLNPKKCKLFRRQVKYLGHIVSCDGVSVDPAKIDTIVQWEAPACNRDLQKYLGFLGYYRRYIANFSKIARPLFELQTAAEWNWEAVHQNSFDTLKECLTKPSILAFPDMSLPFFIHSDACRTGIAGILYQVQHGKPRVIAYASRSLKPSETRYPTHKLEFLAVKWVITEKFKDYLMGATFTVFSDNNPLSYVLTTAKLDATMQRWVAALADFSFQIKFRSGKINIDADILSRPNEDDSNNNQFLQ